MSEPFLEIEDLLGRYREAGQLDSTGGFTLDPKKAAEKLAGFQLPTSYHWILKVVQSLHLSGATKISISAGVQSVKVVSDAVPLGFTTIDDLLGHLLVEPKYSNKTLRHLAAGLQGSLKTRPRQIVVTLQQDGKRHDFELKSGGWRDLGSKEIDPSYRGFGLVLNRSVEERLSSGWFTLNTDVFDLFFRRPAAYDRENLVVYNFCQFAFCDISFGNQQINNRKFGAPRYLGYRSSAVGSGSGPPFWKKLLSKEKLVAGAASPKHHLIEQLVPADSEDGFSVGSENFASISNRNELSPFSKLKRAYAIRMELDAKAKILFVEDGVVIDHVEQSLHCPGLVALIDASHLTKDVTTLKVQRNQRYDELLNEIESVGQQLKSTLFSQSNLLPAPDYVLHILRRTS